MHMENAALEEELDEVSSKTEAAATRSADFDELVLSHLDMLYAVALKLTRNPADAEDLTQDTIVKALRFHDKFQHGSYIKAWLLTILRNTFINDYRRRVRRPSQVALTGAEPAPEPGPDPAVQYQPRGQRYQDVLELLDDNVRRAIDELPEDFRDAVIMADIEDKSYKEIAEIMGRPIGTVMSRLFRGRKLLREKLGDYAAEHGVHAAVEAAAHAPPAE
jgi:RNA polymerase sigma-70 factor (ECF subfamily)